MESNTIENPKVWTVLRADELTHAQLYGYIVRYELDANEAEKWLVAQFEDRGYRVPHYAKKAFELTFGDTPPEPGDEEFAVELKIPEKDWQNRVILGIKYNWELAKKGEPTAARTKDETITDSWSKNVLTDGNSKEQKIGFILEIADSEIIHVEMHE